VTVAVVANRSESEVTQPQPTATASLAANDFELFQLPQRFAIDRTELDARWKNLQRETHPDKFAMQGVAAQRLAMQWSVRINEAYQRLKDPLRRAAYLCELHGFPVQAHSNTHMPTAFLMQQMQWREALDEAQQPGELEALLDEVLSARQAALTACATCLDGDGDAAQAVHEVRALMFMERFMHDVQNRLDALDTH